jgi:uncharacterized membrane protein YjgN (DUF898 family)
VRYAICAAIWWSLILLTLGLAYPFAQSRLERFKMRHTYYGNLQGRFEGSGWRLFFRGLIMWLLVVGPLAFALAYAIVAVDWDKVAQAAVTANSSSEFVGRLETAFPAVYTTVAVSIVAVFISVAIAVVLFPMFQAMVLRWWISGLRLGTLAMHSKLRTRRIYGAYLRFLGYALLFSTVAGIVAGVAFFAFSLLSASNKSELIEVLGAGIGVVFYVVVMLGYSVIYQGTVKLTLWQAAMESIVLEGTSVLDAVKAEGGPSSAVGEGLADALNVGGY